MPSRIRRLVAAMVVVIAVASCNPVGSPRSSGSDGPQPSVCNGVSADVGGCTSPRHSFTASTCVDLAREWATVLDPQLVAVITGPDSVDGNARSVRLRQALVITTSDLNQRLTELGLRDACDEPEFMAAAEPLFSATVRSGVGAALFDGSPATYADWLADVHKVVRSIDDGESAAPSR